MAARLPTPRCRIQHSRFTKQDGWRLKDLSLSLNGNIAVTGCNENTHRTCIDVCTNVRHSDSRDKPKIIFSKEFEKYEDEKWIYEFRYVSFIDDDVLVSCLSNKLEVFQVNKDEVLRSRRVNGIAMCPSVRERREIFIGFMESNKISVYDVVDLNEIKSIILQEIQGGYWPYDMRAIADRICVCEVLHNEESNQRSLIFDEKSGRILSELTKPTDTVTWYAEAISLCIAIGVVAVLWSDSFDFKEGERNQIVFYSLFSENNRSFLIVEVEFGVDGVRISDRGDRMITRNRITDECKVYDMSKFFSYCHLKENLQSQLQEDDCLKLTDFFALPEYQRDKSFKSDAATENLLLALEGKGVIQPYDVDRLTEAFTELKIKSSCSYLVDFYQKTRTKLFYKETIQNLQEKKQEEVEDIKKSLETANIDAKENKAEVQHLQLELQRMKQEQKKTKQLLQQTKDLHQRTALVKNKFKVECDQYKSELESAKQDLLQTKGLLMKATKEKSSISAELEQSQLQKLIKAMSLEESPSGERLAGTTQGKPPEVRRRSDSSLLSAKSGYLQESAIEGEFSMLLVKVAVKLTKNNCVLLATYFNLPEYKTELIREDTGTPGITLLGVMKERNIINMYDVSKLQQALEDIELRGINQSLLKPYQKKIHPLLYEQHKVMQDDS